MDNSFYIVRTSFHMNHKDDPESNIIATSTSPNLPIVAATELLQLQCSCYEGSLRRGVGMPFPPHKQCLFNFPAVAVLFLKVNLTSHIFNTDIFLFLCIYIA